MDLMRKGGGMMGQTSIAEPVAASSLAAAWIRCRRRRRLLLLLLLPNLHTPPGRCCCSRMGGTRTGKKGGAVRGENRWKATGASPSLRAGPCSVQTVLVSLRNTSADEGFKHSLLCVLAVRWCSSCTVSVRPTRRHLLPSLSVRPLLLLSTMTARAMPAKKSSSSCCCCSSVAISCA